MFYFYILENELGTLYFGSSNNLKRRLQERQNNKSFTTWQKAQIGYWFIMKHIATNLMLVRENIR